MKNAKTSSEVDTDVFLFPISERIKEEHLNQTVKNAISLKDLSLEIRKKEASKPIYLIRYE
jgi:hypothetical protein